jgi:lipoyl-dependent peroxiredoxin
LPARRARAILRPLIPSEETTMSFQPLYTAVAHAQPKSLGGSGAPGANPELLFAAGYSACFESALRLVARMRKVAVRDVHIIAEVTIGRTDAGGYGLAVVLRGRFDGVDRDTAAQLMEAAHQVCPYSQATRGNIEVTRVVDEPAS